MGKGTMELYLVRHAEAVSEQEDPKRPLSDSGRETVSRMAGFVKRLNIKVKVIRHSNKLRAEETARKLAEAITSAEGLQAAEDLAPNDDVRPMKSLLEDARENVMIVGHLPYLGRLVGCLLGVDWDKRTVDFKAGCIVRMDRDESSGEWGIRWVLTPDIIKA